MSRTHDVKVRSQGGLQLEQLENLLRQEMKYNPDKVIAQFGHLNRGGLHITQKKTPETFSNEFHYPNKVVWVNLN